MIECKAATTENRLYNDISLKIASTTVKLQTRIFQKKIYSFTSSLSVIKMLDPPNTSSLHSELLMHDSTVFIPKRKLGASFGGWLTVECTSSLCGPGL